VGVSLSDEGMGNSGWGGNRSLSDIIDTIITGNEEVRFWKQPLGQLSLRDTRVVQEKRKGRNSGVLLIVIKHLSKKRGEKA